MTTVHSNPTCLVCDAQDSEMIESTGVMMSDLKGSWHFRKCAQCQMVFLAPKASFEDLSKYYTETYLPYQGASAWGKYAHLVEGDQKNIDHKRTKTVLKYMQNDAKSILDVGCGKPTFLNHIHEYSNLIASGIDFSDKGWKEEKSNYDNLNLFEGLINDLPKSVKPDIITMWHYLEHDYDPRATLQLVHEQAEEDALLIIEVPNHDSSSRKKYGKNWSGYHSLRHIGLFTPDTMKSLLESTGWSVVDQYTYGTLDAYTLDWMSRMEIKSIDWSASMEAQFFPYVMGKLIRPHYYFQKYMNMGFMTAVAKKIG